MTVTDHVTIDDPALEGGSLESPSVEDVSTQDVSTQDVSTEDAVALQAIVDPDLAGVPTLEPAASPAPTAVEAPAAGTAEPAFLFTDLDSRLTAANARLAELADVLGATDAAVDSRLDSLGAQLTAVRTQQADHEQAFAELQRTIAAEVERHTTDALVDTQHSLQLAVNSIAQLSLAMAESSRDLTEDVSAESATALLDSFRVDLDAILGQLGFSSLSTTVGATFDPRRHRALKRVTTADPAQDKLITRVIRDGYLSTATGRILLFADVEVSRHRP